MNASVDYQFHLFTAAENSSRLTRLPSAWVQQRQKAPLRSPWLDS